LRDGLVAPSGDDAGIADDNCTSVGLIVVHRRDAEFGAVPRHVGMIPTEPRQNIAVGVDPRGRNEVGTGDEHDWFVRYPVMMDPYRHDFVDRLLRTFAMTLAHAHNPPTVGGEATIGIPVGVMHRRFRRERHGMIRATGQPIEPLVGPVDEDDIVAVEPPTSAAVLVHAGAGAEPFGEHVHRVAAGAMTNELDAAALFRPGLGPPHISSTDIHVADRNRLGHDEIGSDRGRPRSERCGGHETLSLRSRRGRRCGRCLR
jgi:hypothetical protein